MTISVAVSGASGYAGGEVLRLLAGHPDVTIGAITAHSNAGSRLGELQPHLHGLSSRILEDTTVDNLAGHDVVFLALPHGASAEIAAQLTEGTVVIDAGADHRLEDPAAWEKFYGSAHAGTWPYGLPELPGQREALKGATRIAVPGCYPTSALLALTPGFAANLLQPDDVVIVSASGTSGAGKAAKVNLIGSEVMGSMSPYGVGGGHRHTPEMEQGLSNAAGERVTVSFTPTLAPMSRGILTTATAKVKPGTTAAELRQAWADAYDDEPFVHLLPEGQWPATKSVVGSNHAAMQLALDEHTGRVIVTCVIDNLTKGTAGGAVQSMNIALGLPVTAGLKTSGNPDLALVVNDGPAKSAAAVFTSNRVAAAPVHWSRQVVSDGRVDAVVLNSGGANACTGPQGFQNTHSTAEKVAKVLGISATDVFVCSTGLIGEQLPMDKILPGVEAAAAALSADGGPDAATAIMTTDSVSKSALFIGSDADGQEFTIGGIAKGAGMLAPGLATMLVVLTTDAEVEAELLDVVLRDATRVTFDRADSDGCMSTNDTVVLMASGASGAVPSAEAFGAGLTQVCAELARKLIGDAEGASHDIAIRTFKAATERDAETVSRSVARSNLFKAAIFGKDPNWGRVLSAVGTTDAVFEPDQLNVAINGIQICRNGSIGDDRNLVDLEPREVLVEIDLQSGDAEATIWTNDLTHDYVHENSAYSS